VLKKFSEEILIVIDSIILGVNFILLVSNEVVVVYCASVLFALGNGLMWPSVLSLLSKRAGSTHQGAVQGIAGSFGGLASIIGLMVGGILYHFIGGAIFLISAAVIFVVFILSFRLLGIKKDGW
jgi:MFS transporter, DHA1 family, tetracycline resistance protein